MKIENQDPVITKVINEILKDEALSVPTYRPDLKTEEDARAKSDELPLVYIWNENRADGSCTVSVNGERVEELLEHYIDRGDDRFAPYRDKITAIVSEVSNESVVETCRKLQRFPSEVFAGK
ncbi:MAG: hypothetical protein MOB07_14070 [Acidobacteria bacterium]|nr:hypothetical protein [Acidobacteriota bacterium]